MTHAPTTANRPAIDTQRATSIAREVLGQAFTYVEAHGPNGPWFIETVAIRRYGDAILLYKGGVLKESFQVQDFVECEGADSPVEGLLFEIEMVNRQ